MKTSKEQYLALQAAMVACMDLKVGDTVRVTHNIPEYLEDREKQMGWPISWTTNMNLMVGKEYKVLQICDTGIKLDFPSHSFYFPIFTLEKVRDSLPIIPLNAREEYKAYIQEDGSVIVGCQTISAATLKLIYEASQKQL